MCEDTTFVTHIERKEEAHEENTVTLTHESIMAQALDKYKVLVEKGEWLKKSEQELEFIAMKAEWEVTKKNKRLQQTPRQNRQARSEREGQEGGPRNTGKFAWKAQAPKDGEPHAKTVNGKNYIYCPHHGDTKWVLEVNRKGALHATGCFAKKRAESESGGSSQASITTEMTANTSTTAFTPTKGQKSCARALTTVMMEEDVSLMTEDEILPMKE